MKNDEANPKSEILNGSEPLAAGDAGRRETERRPLGACSFGRIWSFAIGRSPLLCCAALLLVPTALRAADTDAVLNAWLGAQTNFTTWSADFAQTRWLKALNQPLVSTGRVWFAKPNHFRWELGVPAQTVAIRDDEQLQVIYPRLKRAEQYPLGVKSGPMSEALGLLDAGFPKNRADFDARFHVLSLQSTNGAWLLELQPVSASARRMMPAIRVTLAASDFSLLANEMELPDGSRMRNDFHHAVLNANFSTEMFSATVPPDFTIVKPLSP